MRDFHINTVIFEEGALHNLVCIKHTPDSAATMFVENGLVSWGDAPMVVNPWDEYAIEEALRAKDKFGGSVTVLTMGPESSKEALKTAIAMGCDHGILISEESMESYDARITSLVIARAIEKLDNVQIVFFGKQAIDGDTGLVPMSVAHGLGWTGFSYVAELSGIDVENAHISLVRLLEEGKQSCSGKLPAVISVVKEINEPRYPSFVGIRKASKAEVEVLTLDDLELDDKITSDNNGSLTWSEIQEIPRKSTDAELLDGPNMNSIAAQLVEKLVEDKVI
ncbi:MAG: electron transfer flavoprotein subunit beta [Anaerolineaceae bacterium]|nr:electron transfer flavoprotein subunit beta [Anaerolineaceae bacterium]